MSSSNFQPSVISDLKSHALYLWIHLEPNADKMECAKIAANLQTHVDAVCPPDMKNEDDEIWAGVGFGQDFFSQVYGKKTQKNYDYAHRTGEFGELPSTGGDIFIHAKSNSYSKLFELAQKVISQIPPDSVQSAEDVYGWIYQNGRDLSGFLDGGANRKDDEGRESVAVEKSTGGSYVVTMKWIHNHKYLAKTKTKTMETIMGRKKDDGTELASKCIQSHVARMAGGTEFQKKKEKEIVRQAQPFGTVTGESGLFFIGYSDTPEKFEYMLDRMTGAGADGNNDMLMNFTKCVKGNYWYFPGVQELTQLA